MEKLQGYEDEDDDYCNSEEIKHGMLSKMSSWNWVMNAGKKLVLTGVVISSAPVLLPPLLVVSALGFAMSLPFGVGFAAFACTHKLMTNLLPPPPSTPPLLLPYYEDEDLEPDRLLEQQDMVKMGEDIENEIQLRIELVGDEAEETTTAYDPIINVDADLEREGDEEEDEDENNGVIDVEAEVSLQLKESNDAGDKTSPAVVGDDDDVVVADDANKITPAVVGDDVDDTGEKTSPAVVADDANKTSPAVVGDDVDDTASKGDEPKIALKEEKQGNPGIVRPTSNEESEPEKIWEKINAIRVIVGFKAPRRASCLEEVKALYLFTGIEPPPPPPVASDQFTELDAKLNFLMSVIGLK